MLGVLALALLLASAADARAATVCVPGTPACCSEGAGVIPKTRGMTPQQARESLRKAGFTNIGQISRPTDGMGVGQVMGSNPHVDVQVCLGTRVVLYKVKGRLVPPVVPARTYLRNFTGDTISKAHAELLRSDLVARMPFTSCGRRVDMTYPGAWADFVVSGQQPPEGTPIDTALQGGVLQVVPHDGFWRTLEGLPLGQARHLVEARLRQAGWQVAPAATGGPPRFDAKVLAALPNAQTCIVALMTADDGTLIPPPSSAASASTRAADSPGDPSSPAVPLAAAALGALLARMLWPRDRDAKAAIVVADTADLSPRLRIRRDEV